MGSTQRSPASHSNSCFANVETTRLPWFDLTDWGYLEGLWDKAQDLDGSTVFVGPAGCGKTTILRDAAVNMSKELQVSWPAKLTIVAVQIKKMNDMNDMNDTEPLNFGALMEHSICGQSRFSVISLQIVGRVCSFSPIPNFAYIYILLSMFERWTRKKLATWMSFRCFLWLIHIKSYSGMFSPSFHGRKTQRTHIYHRFDINRMTSMDEFKQTHSHIPEFSPCKLQVQVVDLLGDFSDLVGNADLGCLTGTMGTGGVERIRQTIDEHVPEVGCSRFFEVFWSIFCGGFVVVLLDIQILFVGKIIAGILGFDFVISKDRSSSQNFATSIPLSKLGSFAVKPVFAWCVLCGPTCNP